MLQKLYPVNIGSTAHKDIELHSTILIDRQGRIAAIHTGYSGPATGEAHTRMRERFMGEIERVLAEP